MVRLQSMSIIKHSPRFSAGIQYLQGYSGKRNCHPKARKAKASLPWIEAKKMKNELSPEQVSRLIRGAPIEEAIPGYDSREDPDGILLNQQTRPSGLLALQVTRFHDSLTSC